MNAFKILQTVTVNDKQYQRGDVVLPKTRLETSILESLTALGQAKIEAESQLTKQTKVTHSMKTK
jgi:hypothetical protein